MLLQVLGYDDLVDFKTRQGQRVSRRIMKWVHSVKLRLPVPRRDDTERVRLAFVGPAGHEAKTRAMLIRVDQMCTPNGQRKAIPPMLMTSQYHFAWTRAILEGANDGRWHALKADHDGATDNLRRKWAIDLRRIFGHLWRRAGLEITAVRIDGAVQIVYRRRGVVSPPA